MHNKLVVKCPPCKGTGRAAHSERKRRIGAECRFPASGRARSRTCTNGCGAHFPTHHDALRSLSGFLRSEDLPTLPDNPHVVVEFVGEW